MTAREMFEKLGYSFYENHPKIESQQNTFTTQDNPYIEYKQENDTAIEEIRFDLWYKNIWFKGYRKDLKRILPCPINIKELEAINKQVEELGWTNESR